MLLPVLARDQHPSVQPDVELRLVNQANCSTFHLRSIDMRVAKKYVKCVFRYQRTCLPTVLCDELWLLSYINVLWSAMAPRTTLGASQPVEGVTPNVRFPPNPEIGTARSEKERGFAQSDQSR